MKRIVPVDSEKAPDDIKQVYEELKKKKWRIPTMYQTLAHHPQILKAHEHYFDVVMNKGILDRKLKEKVAFKASKLNENAYSTASHYRYALKCGATEEEMRAVDEMLSDQLSKKEIAVLNLVEAMIKSGKMMTDEIFDELKKHFSESEIIELVATVGLMTLASKYANAFGLKPD